MSAFSLDRQATQEEFASIIGVTQQAVSEMVGAGFLVRDETCAAWLLAYCKRLRDKAAGRDNDSVLTRERAALARAQTEAVELKNAQARGEYAPIALLAEVLASASQAIVDRFDSLHALLHKVAPEMPAPARDAVLRVISDARNEWMRSTAELVASRLPDEDEPGEDETSSPDDELDEAAL